MPLIVFDLDGTLIDSRKDLANSVNLMLRERGADPLPEAQVTKMVGEGARVLVDRALAASGLPPENEPSALGRFLEIYDDHLLDHTRPYEGVPEMLERLHSTARLAVLTNKPTSASLRILEGLGLRAYFADVIGGDGGVHPRKPDPGALVHLMHACAVSRDDTLMVGDSPVDLQTARNAGVRCCLVRYGFGFGFAPGELGDGVTVVDTPLAIATVSRARPPREPGVTGHG